MFNKLCRWLESNRGPLVSEATALPTEPHNHCPISLFFDWLKFIMWLATSNQNDLFRSRFVTILLNFLIILRPGGQKSWSIKDYKRSLIKGLILNLRYFLGPSLMSSATWMSSLSGCWPTPQGGILTDPCSSLDTQVIYQKKKELDVQKWAYAKTPITSQSCRIHIHFHTSNSFFFWYMTLLRQNV